MRYSILLVEPDHDRSSAWSEALLQAANEQHISLNVTVARSAAAAQFHAGRRQFHLLIVNLADDGIGLAGRLRVRSTTMRVLLIHAPDVAETILHDARWLGYHLLAVPETSDEVVHAVAQALGLPLTNDPDLEQRPAATLGDVQVLLDVLRWQTRAQLVIFTDYLGNLITQRGDPAKLEIDIISSLIAGCFGNSFELGRAMQDPKTRHLTMLEGERVDVYATNVGSYRLLALIFDKEFVNPKLGYIWLQLKRSADQLNQMRIVEGSVGDVLSSELTASLNTEFDRIFGSNMPDTALATNTPPTRRRPS